MKNPELYDKIKDLLLSKLIKENVFWSYDLDETDLRRISDNQLIALTLKYLDLEDINILKKIFPLSKMKSAWIEYLIPEGKYLLSLNRFIAWYYFDIKKPDRYLKSMETRHINKLTKI